MQMWGGNHQCLSFYHHVAWRQTAWEKWASPGSPFSLKGTTEPNQAFSLSFPGRTSITKCPIVKGPKAHSSWPGQCQPSSCWRCCFERDLLCTGYIPFSADLPWLIWNDQGQQSAPAMQAFHFINWNGPWRAKNCMGFFGSWLMVMIA